MIETPVRSALRFMTLAIFALAACGEIPTPPVLGDDLTVRREAPEVLLIDGRTIEINAWAWREAESPGIELHAQLRSPDGDLVGLTVLDVTVLFDRYGWQVPTTIEKPWDPVEPYHDIYSRTDLRIAPTRVDESPRRDVDIVIHFRDPSGREWYLRAANEPVQRG